MLANGQTRPFHVLLFGGQVDGFGGTGKLVGVSLQSEIDALQGEGSRFGNYDFVVVEVLAVERLIVPIFVNMRILTRATAQHT
jgi:hypothetical protein